VRCVMNTISDWKFKCRDMVVLRSRRCPADHSRATINQVRRPVYNDRNRGTESVRISNRHSCSQYHQLTTLRGPDLTRE
jgi:hypothetical protein